MMWPALGHRCERFVKFPGGSLTSLCSSRSQCFSRPRTPSIDTTPHYPLTAPRFFPPSKGPASTRGHQYIYTFPHPPIPPSKKKPTSVLRTKIFEWHPVPWNDLVRRSKWTREKQNKTKTQKWGIRVFGDFWFLLHASVALLLLMVNVANTLTCHYYYFCI